LHKALLKAIHLYNNKEEWLGFVERIMQEDHSWTGKVDEYVEIYKNLKK
jgi:glycogen synthase